MRNIRFFLMLVFLSFMFSCNKNNLLEKEIHDFYNTKIDLVLDSMKHMGDNLVYDSIFNSEWVYVTYVDSFSCSYCAVNHFSDWAKLEQYREKGLMEYIFVVSPKKAGVSRIVEKVSKDTIWRNQIFIDSAGVFERINKKLPRNRLLHSFLIDKDGTVKLVGNPIDNAKISDMLGEILQ